MRRTLALPVLLAALGGCSLIPDYERPALPVASQWPPGPAETDAQAETAATPAALVGWRDFFKDPNEADLIALSLANNRDLRVAAENVAAAEAQYRIDHASLFPTLDGTGSATAERLPADLSGVGKTLYEHEYSLGLGVVSYELDVFGKIRSETRQAYEQYLGEAETRTSTQITLVAEVASEYLTWVADREALAVSERTADAQHKSYDLTKLNADIGTDTALDVAQAETTWRTAQASVAQYQRQAAQDMDELVLLVGSSLPEPLRTRMMTATALGDEPAFPVLPADLPADLLERRPDIRAAEHALLAANANIGAARAAFFPEVTLTGSAGTESTALQNLFKAGQTSWSFNPQISVPIFDAGKNFASLDYAHIEARIEVATYEKTIQSAFHDVSDALVARTTYHDQRDAEAHLVDADQRYYDLSNLRFTNGVDSYLNVLVAESSLFSAELNLISLKLAEQQNLITLYKALGGGWTEQTATVVRKAGG